MVVTQQNVEQIQAGFVRNMRTIDKIVIIKTTLGNVFPGP